jgi:hypothetical protein
VRGRLFVQCRPCPLERAVDRGDRRVKNRCSLASRPIKNISKNQHGPLPRREQLNGRDECQLNRLSGHNDRVRFGVARCDLTQEAIRIGLLPGNFREGVERWHPTRTPPERVEASVRCDSIQPCPGTIISRVAHSETKPSCQSFFRTLPRQHCYPHLPLPLILKERA